MKFKTNIKKGIRKAFSSYNLPIKSMIIGVFFMANILVSLQAQETQQPQEAQFTQPTWWFGAAAGANFNFFRGSTQQLNSAFTVPTTFHDGTGVGLYLAPLVEFHRPDSRWGFMFQAGYDSRKGTFKQVITPCNCPDDLLTDLSYITVEPSLRFAPFKSGLYLYAGPRLAFLMTQSFTYKHGINPAYPDQEVTPDVTDDFDNMKSMLVSMQIGAGYDIPLTSHGKQTQFVLSPYVSYHPYFGQEPRSIETWNITTVRAGIAIKFGRGRNIETPKEKEVVPVVVVVTEPNVKFIVEAPRNVQAAPIVKETFPIRNYVFFDLGSTEIPERYVLLKKEEVKDFKEDQLDAHVSTKLSGRSDRQMNAYYNILNILGNRMVKNPTTTILLVGSSEKGPQDGREMAESVKEYLVTLFEIDASRITIQGRTKPSVPSEQPGGKLELVLLREGDRRVSIESNSPVLLMEFRSGSDTPLKPVKIIAAQEAPVESYITFNVEDEEDAFTSWSLKTEDEQGAVKTFGPYTEEEVSIPTKSILGTTPEGDYKVTMIGQTKNGLTIERQTSAHMVLWTPAKTEESMRFSILYEFNKSVAINMYEKYLLEVVTPKISDGATVIINGYTDIIGGEENNQKLSLARANGVKRILEKGVSKAGRKNVKFEVAGLGEDQSLSPFNNKYPEERFYNRTVIIDIIPRK